MHFAIEALEQRTLLASIASDPSSKMVSASLASSPYTVSAKNTDLTQNTVSWTDSSGGTTGTAVFRSTSGGPFVQIATVPAPPVGPTAYIDNGLALGTSYSYEVQAVGGPANLFSNVAIATTPAGAPSGEFNVIIGAGAARMVRYHDGDGSSVTINWRGPGSATLSFSGARLTASTKRGVTTVGRSAFLDYFIATGTNAETSAVIAARGHTESSSISYVAIESPIGRFFAPSTQVLRAFAATTIQQLTLATTGTDCTINAGDAQDVSIGWASSTTLQFTSVADFRSQYMSECWLEVSGNLAKASIGEYFYSNAILNSVGSMQFGKISGPDVASYSSLTLHSAGFLSGVDAGGTRFRLRNINPDSDINALLTAQKARLYFLNLHIV
jgi:hypothetical protein